MARDEVEFSIEFLDTNLSPLATDPGDAFPNVDQNDEFWVQVSVDDLNSNAASVMSAFLDLAYTNRHVEPVLDANNSPDVAFGPNFASSTGVGGISDEGALGRLDEFGGVRSGTGNASGPEVLFRIPHAGDPSRNRGIQNDQC